MIGQLKVIEGPDEGKVFSLPRNQPVFIGKSLDNAIFLNDFHVERVHCRVRHEGSKVLITDNDSPGGTWVNGEQVKESELQPGDVVTVGETQLTFQWTDSDEKSTMEFMLPREP